MSILAPHRHNQRRFVVCLMFVGLFSSSWARGDESVDPRQWQFSLTPYFWAAGIKGESGTLPGLPPAEVDESFSDIYDDLEFAGMIVGSARYGSWILSGDLQYVETTAEDNSLAPLFNEDELNSTSLIGTALVERVLYEKDRSALIASAGARVWSVETELKLSSGLLPGQTIDGDDTWIDPVIGGRWLIGVGDRVSVHTWMLLGGFGAGSDLMADALVSIGYKLTSRLELSAGYRWMSVDRRDGDFLYDVRQEGPVVGITIAFPGDR